MKLLREFFDDYCLGKENKDDLMKEFNIIKEYILITKDHSQVILNGIL